MKFENFFESESKDKCRVIVTVDLSKKDSVRGKVSLVYDKRCCCKLLYLQVLSLEALSRNISGVNAKGPITVLAIPPFQNPWKAGQYLRSYNSWL